MEPLGFSVDCHECGFSGNKALRDATKQETCATQTTRKIKYLEAREEIFRQGDAASGIYSLIYGTVMISMVDARGGAFVPRLVTPGNAFGYRSSLENSKHTSTAIALTDCCFCQISQERSLELVNQNQDVRGALVNSCTQDILSAREEIILYSSMNLPERLLHFMITKLLHIFGSVEDDGSAKIQLPLKRGELAMSLGVQAETLSRAIKKLKNQELAFFENKTVLIPSLRQVEDHIQEELPVAL